MLRLKLNRVPLYISIPIIFEFEASWKCNAYILTMAERNDKYIVSPFIFLLSTILDPVLCSNFN